jgi:hypothetical protein
MKTLSASIGNRCAGLETRRSRPEFSSAVHRAGAACVPCVRWPHAARFDTNRVGVGWPPPADANRAVTD